MRQHQGRNAVLWLVFTLSVTVAVIAPAQEQQTQGLPRGCALQGLGPDGPGDAPLLRSTGNEALDAAIGANLDQLAARFGALPRLYYLNDVPPNAYATPELKGEQEDFPPERNPFGTMLLGINLLNSELRATPPGQKNYTITAIMAHELGHTLQALKGSALPTMHKEIQADFLAGWAIKFLQRTGAPEIDEADVFGSFYRKGDYAFNSPDHHGTKIQRLAAFLAGFEVEDNDANAAYAKAEGYVRSQMPPVGPPQVQREFFAQNLGVFYEIIPNPDQTFAIRVSRPPDLNSAAGLGGIEAGDIILALDSMPFRAPQDVLNHVGETTVSVIDFRTGQRQEGVIQIR